MADIQYRFDVIVVGGGHAGAEAALAAARLGARTLLLTMNMDHIAQMSCNPAIGGIAKGQVVREVDALGGAIARVSDAATIQFRILNRTKGPAVWSPRAQCDKVCYQRAMKRELEIQENLLIHQAEVQSLLMRKQRITAVKTQFNETFTADAFVLCTGTFLRGKLHYGLKNFPGGRAGDSSADRLSESLAKKLRIRIGRLKTGTPQRILAKTIDFSKMKRQDAETAHGKFSYFREKSYPQTTRQDMPCYLVQSTAATAEIIRKNLDKSPLYSGKISGIGTRYCPSFEDKVVRFPHHETHTIYLEPEGEFTEEYYLNGISTSLPPNVQLQMLHSIPGLEQAVISRYAYAIEYDFVFPDQIDRSLRLKSSPNLFLAGQINGTSGYEEAAGQGLIAGFNAARCAAGKNSIELGRESSYIGVMIDDLVTKDIIEPYRLFTSRAEYRLHLRQDNADLRLCPLAAESGLLPNPKIRAFKRYSKTLEQAREKLAGLKIEGRPAREIMRDAQGMISAQSPLQAGMLGLRENNREDLRAFRQLAVECHYAGYLAREEKSIGKLRKLEDWQIPPDFDYQNIPGLRNESRAKLIRITPTTLAQAARIDGVTPPEISLLQIHLKRRQN